MVIYTWFLRATVELIDRAVYVNVLVISSHDLVENTELRLVLTTTRFAGLSTKRDSPLVC